MPRPNCHPVAADVIVEIADRIVLIELKNLPFGWAIPGGFVDFGESMEQAAAREAREEISLDVKLRALHGVYSRLDRDPRGQTISVVYVGWASGAPQAADDAKQVALVSLKDLPSPMAFDHAEILADYARFVETGAMPMRWST
jgi:8-oxo-dGTP diphosphatase